MKKILICLLLLSMLLCSCAERGNIFLAVTERVSSDVYSEQEIDDAIDEAMSYFQKHFNGCTLTTISYAGDEKTADWEGQYGNSEVIVLTSSFLTGPQAGDGSLNPNDIYTKWKWILIRNPGGRWKHADHGY